MNRAFIYLVIFSSVVLLIYYVVIIYFDMMKDKNKDKDNEIFIPDTDDSNSRSKNVTADGVVVEGDITEENSDIYIPEVLGFSPSDSEEDNDRENENHEYVDDPKELEVSSGEELDITADSSDGNNLRDAETFTSGDNEDYPETKVAKDENNESTYWDDPFAFVSTEESTEDTSAIEESSPQISVTVYDSNNVKTEKDQEECNEINESLEPAEKYYPGEFDIQTFAQRIHAENAPDIVEDFMERM